MGLVESYFKRAFNKLSEAEQHFKYIHYPESISAAQECIEFSIKAMFLLIKGDFPRKHEFTEEEYMEVFRQIPEKLGASDYAKLYLYSKFWLGFYTIAKYGLEKLGIGADKLFEREEAELALKHARRCWSAGQRLRGYILTLYK